MTSEEASSEKFLILTTMGTNAELARRRLSYIVIANKCIVVVIIFLWALFWLSIPTPSISLLMLSTGSSVQHFNWTKLCEATVIHRTHGSIFPIVFSILLVFMVIILSILGSTGPHPSWRLTFFMLDTLFTVVIMILLAIVSDFFFGREAALTCFNEDSFGRIIGWSVPLIIVGVVDFPFFLTLLYGSFPEDETKYLEHNYPLVF